MDPRFARLLTEQQATGFADLRGATIAANVPIADRLLNAIVSASLPASGRVRDVQLHAREGNRIGVRVKLGAGTFPPPISLTLVIEGQPQMPASPVLVLRLEMGGLLSLAGPALRFLDALPPGVRVEHDRVYVDLAAVLADHGLTPWLEYIEQLGVTTVEGAVVVSVMGRVRA